MAQCKLCGRSGLFLKVTASGLCNNCSPVVLMEVNSRFRVIKESMELAEKGKTLDTRLSRCDLVIEHCQTLTKYERLGINTLDPSPSTIAYKYQAKRNEIVTEGLINEAQKTMEKVKVATTPKAKITTLSKLLLLIREYKAKTPTNKQIDELEKHVSATISQIQLEAYLGEANKAEFKGNKKKALDQYYEALYFLRHDEIDDSLQAKSISEIEAKIRELSGKQGDIIDL